MPFGGLLTTLLGVGIPAVTSLITGQKGANASNTASGQQVDAGNQAIDFLKGNLGQQQGSQQPFTDAGTLSIGMLMKALQNGTFGPGSLPGVPQFNAPTLQDAQNSPGYQFAAQQGSKGILQGAAAAGGAISGGTLKALDAFNTNLADSTYGDVFNRALSTYGAGLQGYQTNLARQAQEYQQLFQPSVLGETAVQNLNNNRTQAGVGIADLMTQIGNARAAGTIGSTNATNRGLGDFSNILSQGIVGIGKPATPKPGLPKGAGISELMNLPQKGNPLGPFSGLGPG